MIDTVHVTDSGRIRLLREKNTLVERPFEDGLIVGVKGWVMATLRERGKLVSQRQMKVEGNNVWTNTGREYNAMLQTYKPDHTAYRSDRIAYIGAGTGAQVEQVNVSRLAVPAAYVGSGQNAQFLAGIDHNATDFPLYPSRTTARYVRLFAESELTVEGVPSIVITELGLFTDGDPDSNYQAGTRKTSLADGAQQAPMAYKAIPEGIQKTNVLELQIEWEIRF